MRGNGYIHLTSAEKKYYSYMLEKMSNYAFEFCFENVTFEFLAKIFRAVLSDNPQFFWFTGVLKGKTLKKENGTKVVFCPEIFPTDADEIKKMNSCFKSVLDGISERAKQYETDFERVLFVHDYLIDNVSYDKSAQNRNNAYGCLAEKKAVCSGYSAAFQLIMNELGYECGRVIGKKRKKTDADVLHEWNYIKIEDDCYFIDVTDDTADKYGNKIYDYFLIDCDELKLTHIVSDENSVPLCKGKKYNYFSKNGLFFEKYSFEEAAMSLKKQLKTGNVCSLKFSSQAQAQKATDDLIMKSKIYSLLEAQGKVLYSLSKSGLILNIITA